MAKKRKKQIAVVIGTTGKGRTYSREYAINNNVKMPEPPKREKQKIISKSFVGLGKTMPTEHNIRNRFSINTTNISKFLNTLTESEFIYLNNTVNTAVAIRDVIKKYDISKERFCKEMDIKKTQFNSYMAGSRNYDLKDIAKLNALAHTLYMENAEKNAEKSTPIKTVDNKK